MKQHPQPWQPETLCVHAGTHVDERTGGVNTPMLQRARQSAREKPPEDLPMLEPEEIADGVVQLIADDSLAGRVLLIVPGLRDFAPLPGQ